MEFLPSSASRCALKIVDSLKIKECKYVKVIGKQMASETELGGFNEADIIIGSTKDLNLSLKFNKYSSYVNTKSAGIKSFFYKYFSLFEDYSKEAQLKFNELWDVEFETFAIEMHKEANIEYTNSFESWSRLRDDLLPGQLDGIYKDILHNFYGVINTEVARILREFYQKDNSKFIKSLMSLLGFTNNKIIQVCFYYNNTNNNYIEKSIILHTFEDVYSMLDGDLAFKVNRTNLDIYNDRLKLQIRLKPMNTFTQKCYKINCAVKFS